MHYAERHSCVIGQLILNKEQTRISNLLYVYLKMNSKTTRSECAFH